MQRKPRLFIGGHRELRRPVNTVDESLMKRIDDARQRLRLEGKDVKPLLNGSSCEPQQGPQSSARRAFERRVRLRLVSSGDAGRAPASESAEAVSS